MRDGRRSEDVGKRVKTEGEKAPGSRLHSVGCLDRERCDYTMLHLNVSKGENYTFW
jgi:hypothetical protein